MSIKNENNNKFFTMAVKEFDYFSNKFKFHKSSKFKQSKERTKRTNKMTAVLLTS